MSFPGQPFQLSLISERYDIEHDDTQHNDVHYTTIKKRDTQHNDSVVMLNVSNKPFIPSVVMLIIVAPMSVGKARSLT